MKNLQQELGITYLFIAHDLSMIRYISHRVCVMYLGKIVEIGNSEDIYNNPKHSYTKALLSSIPSVYNENDEEILEGDVPSPLNPPSGCRFRTRCKHSKKICCDIEPCMIEVDKDHFVSCHFID